MLFLQHLNMFNMFNFSRSQRFQHFNFQLFCISNISTLRHPNLSSIQNNLQVVSGGLRQSASEKHPYKNTTFLERIFKISILGGPRNGQQMGPPRTLVPFLTLAVPGTPHPRELLGLPPRPTFCLLDSHSLCTFPLRAQ